MSNNQGDKNIGRGIATAGLWIGVGIVAHGLSQSPAAGVTAVVGLCAMIATFTIWR